MAGVTREEAADAIKSIVSESQGIRVDFLYKSLHPDFTILDLDSIVQGMVLSGSLVEVSYLISSSGPTGQFLLPRGTRILTLNGDDL